MKPLTACLLLIPAVSCTTNYREQMAGDWVSVMDKNIRLHVRDNGKDLIIQYYYPDFLIDSSKDSDGKQVRDTLTEPHKGEWMKAAYNNKRCFLVATDHSKISYDPDNDALVRVNASNEVRVFGGVR